MTKNKTLTETELQTAVAGFTKEEIALGKIVGDAVVDCIHTQSDTRAVTAACVEAWFKGGSWRYIRGGMALQKALRR